MEPWELSLTDEDLKAIDAICDSVSSSSTSTFSSSPIKRPHVSTPTHTTSADDDTRRRSRRRLPDSLFIFQEQVSASSSILPCRKTRSHRSSSTYYQGNLTTRYQELAYKGQIMYSRTAAEVDRAAGELLKFVEAERRKKEGQVVLGFDIEWRPTFKRGVAPGKAAVMQICADNSCCYVMHIIHSGIPQKLQCLLEDPTLVKVGVCIANDASKVFQDHNVSVKALEDLSDLANQKLGGAPKKWSLASLTETLICKQLPKPNKIRLGNWEADILSKEKLQYAATDAFVSWYLYQVIKSLPEAVNNKSEEPEEVAPH